MGVRGIDQRMYASFILVLSDLQNRCVLPPETQMPEAFYRQETDLNTIGWGFMRAYI